MIFVRVLAFHFMGEQWWTYLKHGSFGIIWVLKVLSYIHRLLVKTINHGCSTALVGRLTMERPFFKEKRRERFQRFPRVSPYSTIVTIYSTENSMFSGILQETFTDVRDTLTHDFNSLFSSMTFQALQVPFKTPFNNNPGDIDVEHGPFMDALPAKMLIFQINVSLPQGSHLWMLFLSTSPCHATLPRRSCPVAMDMAHRNRSWKGQR